MTTKPPESAPSATSPPLAKAFIFRTACAPLGPPPQGSGKPTVFPGEGCPGRGRPVCVCGKEWVDGWMADK